MFNVVVDVAVDSHIQHAVLATEEGTVTQQVSHRPINANPACGHKEIRRSTGHVMVITRYSDQPGSESRQNPCQVRPPDTIGNLPPPPTPSIPIAFAAINNGFCRVVSDADGTARPKAADDADVSRTAAATDTTRTDDAGVADG